jgi:hypothetical protein
LSLELWRLILESHGGNFLSVESYSTGVEPPSRAGSLILGQIASSGAGSPILVQRASCWSKESQSEAESLVLEQGLILERSLTLKV